MIVLTGYQEMPAGLRDWDKVMRGEEERLEEICLICWRWGQRERKRKLNRCHEEGHADEVLILEPQLVVLL